MMPVTVVPITHAFRTVAVRGKTGKIRIHGLHRSIDEFRPINRIVNELKGGAQDIVPAYRIPVVARINPPLINAVGHILRIPALRLHESDISADRGEYAELHLAFDTRNKSGVDSVGETIHAARNHGSKFGRKKIHTLRYSKQISVAAPDLTVMGREHPRFPTAERPEIILNARDVSPLPFLNFSRNEHFEIFHGVKPTALVP